MCAVAFCEDVFTDKVPKPPIVIRNEVKRAGGNKRWIANDPIRLKLFEEFYRNAVERKITFAGGCIPGKSHIVSQGITSLLSMSDNCYVVLTAPAPDIDLKPISPAAHVK
jgi:hypothetical protein